MNNIKSNKTSLKNQNNIDSDFVALIPPQSRELEDAVIGAVLIENEAFSIASDIISTECFYFEPNKIIWDSFVELHSKKKPIDFLTVKEELSNKKVLEDVGGVSELVKYTTHIASAVNIEFHSRVILEKYMRREIIRIGYEMSKRGYDESDDIFDLIEEARILIDSVDNVSTNEMTFAKMDKLIKEKTEKLKDLIANPNSLAGTSTGYSEWDAFTGGLHAPDLIIVAGRPGMGKTLVGRNIASNVAEAISQEECVLVFALEEGADQYAENVIAGESWVEKDRIKRLQLTDGDFKTIEEKTRKFNGRNYLVDDTASISIQAMERKCRKVSKKKKIRLIVVDYLQLCTTTTKNGNREQEIAEISRGLKGMAKKFNCPVIALAQLSREVEKTRSKRPTLSSLRESGAIEQDADIVIFPWRPEYYGMEEYEGDNGFHVSNTKDLILIEFAKHRNGQLGEFPMSVDLKTNNLLPYRENTDWVNSIDFSKSRKEEDMGEFDNFVF